MSNTLRILFAALLVAASCGHAVAGAGPQPNAGGNESRTPGTLDVTLAPGPGLSVDVTLDFESVTNLSLPNAGISATVIDPMDALLLARLPLGSISIPAAFPVLVDITPPAGLTPLTFDGLATLTLRTDNLPYYDGIRLRLFAAHGGGDFADITNEVSQGSYRVRGSNGDFSEFLIVQDDRNQGARSTGGIVDIKLAALQARLVSFVLIIDALTYATLTSQLANAEADWLADQPADAIIDLDAFKETILASTPAEIPQTWVAPGGMINANGVLRSMAESLQFSLAEQPCPANGDYTDSDADGVPDECDNCTLVSNPSQCDSNEDGYGNHCDADLNDNGVINFADLGLMKSIFFSANSDADLDCNGVVNFSDLATMKSVFFGTPGPSAVAP